MPTEGFADRPLVPTDELIQRFEQAAIAYGVAAGHYEEEDVPETDWYSEMNRLDKEKWALTLEVRRRGPEGELPFLGLLHHPEPYVRAEAAMQAIRFAPSEAAPVLREIGARRGWIGFYARKALAFHRAGVRDATAP